MDFEREITRMIQYFPNPQLCEDTCWVVCNINTIDMKANSLLSLSFFLPLIASAQPRAAVDFQITKITKSLVSTPQFAYTGAPSYPTNQRDRWLEVEVEFAAAPELTDELTFKYYILFNGNLLTGEVTHVNIPAGRENRSVM